jgi:hypothetical protein
MSGLLDLVAKGQQYYPIYKNIMPKLDAGDVIRLQRVSKELSSVYEDALKSEWKINAYLKPFFADPVQFRNVQAETEALITKNVALGFFESRYIPSSDENFVLDMHLVVTSGPQGDALNAFVESEGYTEVSSSNIGTFTFGRKFTFVKPVASLAGQLVEITIEHRLTPASAFLQSILCTNMGNFVAWDKAYCLFPAALAQKMNYLTSPMPDGNTDDDRIQRQYLRESSRGFTLKNAEWIDLLDKTSTARLELGPLRQFGDRYSWIIDLDKNDIVPPEEPSMLLEFATFSLSKNEMVPESVIPYLELDADVLQSVAIRQKYMLLSPPQPRPRYSGPKNKNEQDASAMQLQYNTLIESLKQAARLQFTMLEPADRPPHYTAVAEKVFGSIALDNFTMPDWWSYHDAAVQEFLLRLRTYIETRRIVIDSR